MTMQPLLPWLAERFLNGVPEGIAIALLAWLLLRIFTRSGSSTRFAIWLSALAAIIVIPLARGIWLSKGTLISAPHFGRFPTCGRETFALLGLQFLCWAWSGLH